MKAEVYKDLKARIESLLSDVNKNDLVPCERLVDKRSCLQQMQDKRIQGGKIALYYDTGCQAATKLCNTCQLDWHIAVALNKLLDHQRHVQLAEEGEKARVAREHDHERDT